MNTRLSQRVYSESSLEFWLQRLGGEWEQLFSDDELARGRRLYRRGAVRQVELGGTDAIAHLRTDDGAEAYVVLDWEKPELSIRASVEDRSQRRELAVAGLYEVEELVGDEAAALPPEGRSPAAQDDSADRAASTAQDNTSAGARAQNPTAQGNTSAKAGGKNPTAQGNAPVGARGQPPTDAPATDSENASPAKTSRGSGRNTLPKGSEKNQSAEPEGTSRPRTGISDSKPSANGAASAEPQNSASGNEASRRAAGSAPADGIAAANDNAAPAQQQAVSGSLAGGTGGTAPVNGAVGKNSLSIKNTIPKPLLALHFKLRQGALVMEAGWRQAGKKKLLPALGESALSAEAMDASGREALIRLASLARRAGFRYEKKEGDYRLAEPDALERFVSKEIGAWAEYFAITQDADVALLARGVQEVSLRARIEEDKRGNLSLEWIAKIDTTGGSGDAFTAAERRRLLRSGSHSLILPGRGIVRLSERQAKASEHLNDAVSLFPGGAAPRYLLFSLTGVQDFPVEVSASLQRWRQKVIGGMALPPVNERKGAVAVNNTPANAATTASPESAAATTAIRSGSGTTAKTDITAAAASPESGVAKADTAAASPEGSVAGTGASADTKADAPIGSFAAASVEGRRDTAVKQRDGKYLPEFLRGYQKLGVTWMRHLFERGCHGLLADEMGLGKTVQVLSLIATSVDSGKPALVVCPASVVPVWQAQAAQFFPQLGVAVLGAACTFAGEGAPERQPDLWVASYTQLRRHKALLDKIAFSCAVLDEAQFIKNPEAKVTQACLALKADHRLTLTGTPLENRYLDVWTLFRFLMPGLLGTRRRFEDSLSRDESRYLLTLRKQLAPFILRRTKSDVASELPEKVELDLVCSLSDLQRTEYQRLLSGGFAPDAPAVAMRHAQSAVDFADLGLDSDKSAFAATDGGVPQGGQGDPNTANGATLMSVLTLLTRLRQVACDPGLLPWVNADLNSSGKLNLLRDRLGEVFANGKKAVVFSQFVKFLTRAKQAIRQDFPDVPVFELTGGTRDRVGPVDRFQEQDGAGVFLVSLRAGGTGITLHAADYVFLLDPWWNPAVEAQAIDRVHRIGQVNRVFVYRMITAGTVEARVAALKREKYGRFEQIVGGASRGEDFREAFRSLESLLGLLKEDAVPSEAVCEPVQAND